MSCLHHSFVDVIELFMLLLLLWTYYIQFACIFFCGVKCICLQQFGELFGIIDVYVLLFHGILQASVGRVGECPNMPRGLEVGQFCMPACDDLDLYLDLYFNAVGDIEV